MSISDFCTACLLVRSIEGLYGQRTIAARDREMKILYLYTATNM